MAELVLTNAKVWFDKYDVSGDLNAVAINYGADSLDITAMSDLTRNRIAGLKTVTVQHEGIWQGDTIDDYLFSNIAVLNKPMTMASLPTEGTIAYSFKSMLSEYNPINGAVGDLTKFSVTGEANGDLIRGSLILNSSYSTSGNGTGQQLGAVSATQNLYAALHVTSVGSTSPQSTLDVIVQSDDNASFTSATNRITFSQATAITSEWATPVAGAITDDYWRINYTISGGGTFAFAVFVGIQ